MWNEQLFLWINASADPAGWIVGFALLLANSPDVLGPAVLVGLWVWGPVGQRGALLAVAGGMLVGLGINQLLGVMCFEPRPFVIGLGHTWLAHAPDNSFPSDHATFVWSLGAGLVATGAARRWGGSICVYGVLVAWSRVYLGVHFPIDMLASVPIALVSGGVARLAQPGVTAWVLPVAGGAYDAGLTLLHLPAGLFPRRARAGSATQAFGRTRAPR
jgi:undecaprenyl-diphosphatase